jgi:hypothetical protein
VKIKHIPALCAALVIGIIGAAVARITGSDIEDDLDDEE